MFSDIKGDINSNYNKTFKNPLNTLKNIEDDDSDEDDDNDEDEIEIKTTEKFKDKNKKPAFNQFEDKFGGSSEEEDDEIMLNEFRKKK